MDRSVFLLVEAQFAVTVVAARVETAVLGDEGRVTLAGAGKGQSHFVEKLDRSRPNCLQVVLAKAQLALGPVAERVASSVSLETREMRDKLKGYLNTR